NRLPLAWRGQSREGLRQIPLSYLRQKPPDAYKLGPGDVLAVYIEGALGKAGELPPINFSEKSETASTGYPLTVDDDGTLPLPIIKPLRVSGLTLKQAKEAIFK